MFESRISAGGTEKLPSSETPKISAWSYDMEGHAKKGVRIRKQKSQQLYKKSTFCMDDHVFEEE